MRMIIPRKRVPRLSRGKTGAIFSDHALLNGCSEFSSGFNGTFLRMRRLILALTEEDSMKKFGYIIAALGVFAIAAPSIASAQDVVVGRDRDHARGEFREHRGEFREHRAEFREHRDHGWRRHHDKVVIIKHSGRVY
ncbi:MAG TPA: hypothetical protein VFH41_00765 [Bradyrhizobium sp.]|nr:hypothetical protein [Bradyrhizobium sp.]